MNTAFKLDKQQKPFQLIQNTGRQATLNEMFELFGWDHLPFRVKKAIEDDMIFFHNELYGFYTDCSDERIKRKKRVCYWVDFLRDNPHAEDIAVHMLTEGELN
jgi:hypothetical protein